MPLFRKFRFFRYPKISKGRQPMASEASGNDHVGISGLMNRPWVPYVAPFVIFILITSLTNYFPAHRDIIYITKTFAVGALLWFWRRHYVQDMKPRLGLTGYLTAFLAGLLVLVLWIVPDGVLPKISTPVGFNPYSFGWPQHAVVVLIAIRLAGAALVVPVMEELFWRSFIMRYAINPDFRSVPLGTFSLFSFSVTVILFGLEHFRVIQGVFAGIIYGWLAVKQKTLRGSIPAHATTNLGLGIYVLYEESWLFW